MLGRCPAPTCSEAADAEEFRPRHDVYAFDNPRSSIEARDESHLVALCSLPSW
jgi:hypothetical protein